MDKELEIHKLCKAQATLQGKETSGTTIWNFFLPHAFFCQQTTLKGPCWCDWLFSVLSTCGAESCRTFPIRTSWAPQSVPQQEETLKLSAMGHTAHSPQHTAIHSCEILRWELLMKGLQIYIGTDLGLFLNEVLGKWSLYSCRPTSETSQGWEKDLP